MQIILNGTSERYVKPSEVALRNYTESLGHKWTGYIIEGNIMRARVERVIVDSINE